MLHFTKMNGAGNDFVMLDNRDGTIRLEAAQIVLLCDRHRGVGADGVLLLEPGDKTADFQMRYYNSDGGEAEMCGNGARCFARFAQRAAGPFKEVSFSTLAGVIRARIEGEVVTLDLGSPSDLVLKRKLPIQDSEFVVHSVNTGVPHVVVFVENLEQTPVLEWGRAIRYHPAFQPKGTNANFVTELQEGRIAVRTYERGVEGETLACGTGVTASALVYALLHDIVDLVHVKVRGGDWLQVGFRSTGGSFENLTLTGPADFVFEGEYTHV
jgi:diaminopimelate epimerase